MQHAIQYMLLGFIGANALCSFTPQAALSSLVRNVITNVAMPIVAERELAHVRRRACRRNSCERLASSDPIRFFHVLAARFRGVHAL